MSQVRTLQAGERHSYTLPSGISATISIPARVEYGDSVRETLVAVFTGQPNEVDLAAINDHASELVAKGWPGQDFALDWEGVRATYSNRAVALIPCGQRKGAA